MMLFHWRPSHHLQHGSQHCCWRVNDMRFVSSISRVQCVCLPVRLWTHILIHFAPRCYCVHHSLAISVSLSWTMPGFIMEKEFLSWLLNSICALTACMPLTFSPTLEAQIEFLPPYFPDLNLIEEASLKVKKFFQQKLGMACYLTWCRLWRLLPPLMWLVILYMLDISRL